MMAGQFVAVFFEIAINRMIGRLCVLLFLFFFFALCLAFLFALFLACVLAVLCALVFARRMLGLVLLQRLAGVIEANNRGSAAGTDDKCCRHGSHQRRVAATSRPSR